MNLDAGDTYADGAHANENKHGGPFILNPRYD